MTDRRPSPSPAEPDLPLPPFARQPWPPLDRRTFLAGLGTTAFTALIGTTMAGCSGGQGDFVNLSGPAGGGTDGGGGGGGVDFPNTQEISGQVDLAAFGNPRGLLVQSIYAADSPVGEDGSFTSRVSTENAQLLLLTQPPDVSAQGTAFDRIRGIIVHSPCDDSTALTFGADAVAVTFIFLTAGIITVDPEEVCQVLVRIRELALFGAFSARVATLLLNPFGWATLVRDPDFASLRQGCIDAYSASVPSDTEGGVKAAFETTDPETSRVKLQNFGYRFVSLIRQDLDGQGLELAHGPAKLVQAVTPLFGSENQLSGANSVSWGNLFTGQAKSAASAFDTRIDPIVGGIRQGVDRIRYYAAGPGTLGGSAELPPSIPFTDFDIGGATITTIVYYLLFPFMDLLAGTKTALQLGPQAAMKFWEELAPSINTDAIRVNINSGDEGNINASIIDALVGVLLVPVLAAVFGATSAVVVAAGLLMAAFAAIFSLFNLSLFAQNMLALPSLTKVDLGLASLTLLGQGVLAVNGTGDVIFQDVVPPSTTARLILRRAGQPDVVLPEGATSPPGGVGLGDDGSCHFLDVAGPVVRRPDGTLVPLPADCSVTDINDQGQVVGVVATPGAPSIQSIFYANPPNYTLQVISLRSLLGLPEEAELAVFSGPRTNNSGQVVMNIFTGRRTPGEGDRGGVPLPDQYLIDLEAPGASNLPFGFKYFGAVGLDLNDDGHIAATGQRCTGQENIDETCTYVTVLRQGGAETTIPGLPGSINHFVHFLNNSDQMVGSSSFSSLEDNYSFHPTIWENGAATDLLPDLLGAVPNLHESVGAISDFGDGGHIVGTLNTTDPDPDVGVRMVGFILKVPAQPRA